MAINEVFLNPTIRQVIFQIRFPNLFYLESRMGEFQMKVMKDFPKSGLTLSRQFVIAEVDKIPDVVKMQDESRGLEVGKIWNFASENGVELHVKTNSLDLSSTLHKTYNNPKETNRFRDMIKNAVDAFLEVAPIPIISRIGLRYIDNCPVPAQDNVAYREYYNTCLPLDRFALADAEDMSYSVRVRRGKHFVRFVEAFQKADGKPQLMFDFDGYALNIDSATYLAVTDELHNLVVAEYEACLKPPVFEYMRKPRA